jgi:PadR family transcriptional regulator, regulatory protein PadR
VCRGVGAEALKGHLDMLLLAIVSETPSHGYAVIEELRRRSDEAFDLPEGTIYPALHRLERAGLLTSSWSTHGGRRRRVYRISPKGGRVLERQRGEWSAFAAAVQRVVRGEALWPKHA